MTTRAVYFDNTLLKNCGEIEEQLSCETSVTVLASGQQSIQDAGYVNKAWKFTFASETRTDITGIYLKTGKKALSIDGQTYNYCNIISRDPIKWNALCNWFEGGVTIAQESATFARNLILNPGFETGTTKDWTAVGSPTVELSAAYQGDYGCKLLANSETTVCSVAQTVDFTNTYTLTLWIYITQCGTGGEFTVTIDGQEELSVTSATSGWTRYTIDVEAYSGENEIVIAANYGSATTCTVYLDSIEMYESDEPIGSSDRVTNGDFETGDLTGWTVDTTTGWHGLGLDLHTDMAAHTYPLGIYQSGKSSVAVSTAAKLTGTYGCELTLDHLPIAAKEEFNQYTNAYLETSIDLTSVSYIEYDVKVTNTIDSDDYYILYCAVCIDGVVKKRYSQYDSPSKPWAPITCDWTHDSINTSLYVGEHTLQVFVLLNAAFPNVAESHSFTVYLDNVTAYASD